MVDLQDLHGYIENYLSEWLKTTSLADVKPSAYSWVFPNELQNGQGISYIDKQASLGTFPTLVSLAPALVYALMFGVVRMVLHHLLFKPMAMWAYKLDGKTTAGDKVIDSALELEKCNFRPKQGAVKAFCAQHRGASTSSSESSSNSGGAVNYSDEEAVSSYVWDRRHDFVNNRKVVKFVEAVWRFIFYLVFEIVGYFTLVSPTVAPWLGDTTQHWEHWPLHDLTGPIRFYYQVELGSYIHQFLWTEVERSDAVEMMVHHLTTIALISLSYLTNFTRVGTSILFLHDSADIFLESAKIFNYISKADGRVWAKHMTDVVFATFAIIFFITRIIVYPRFILSSVLYEAPVYLGGSDWIGFYVFAGLLIVLQVLHIFWFYLIARMIYKLITTGIEKDERSDDEEEEPKPGGDKKRQ